MNPALTYWVAVAALGLAAALGSFFAGLTYSRYLHRMRPELARSYWPETVRDVLLVIGLGFNLLVGIMAIDPAPNPIRNLVALVAILGGATCLSLFAIFNFALRVGKS